MQEIGDMSLYYLDFRLSYHNLIPFFLFWSLIVKFETFQNSEQYLAMNMSEMRVWSLQHKLSSQT